MPAMWPAGRRRSRRGARAGATAPRAVIERMEAVSSVEGKGRNLIRALLPKYVEAEAERIGCGPIRLTLPEVLE